MGTIVDIKKDGIIMNNNENKMYQVSTLQALALGYTKAVIDVEELLLHGNTGLGTFQDVNGEMIMVNGHCYRAKEDGSVEETPEDEGVPFCAVTMLSGDESFETGRVDNVNSLKEMLDLKIEEDFGLNSMHVIRIDGLFEKVFARSESAYHSQHVELKDVLAETQKDFSFDYVKGSLVCVYFPDYMDGINAPGWHFHFVSWDRMQGGHVFELIIKEGHAIHDKIDTIEIRNPKEPSFDTYSLKEASQDDIKKVEQGE